MYAVDGKDTVRKLDNLRQSSIGAPIPVVLSDEHSTLVAYIMEQRDPNWDGTTCRVIGPDSDGEPIVVVRFIQRCALIFGPPNDEAFSGHPLASRGLTPYGTFEVLQSSWIRGLERMNSVHPYHRTERYQELRHFVLSFHDSTLECVAKDLQVVETLRGSMNQAISRMAAMIAEVAK